MDEAEAGFGVDELGAGPDEPLLPGAEEDGQIGSPQPVVRLGDGGAELLGGADVVGGALLVLGALLLLGAVLVSVGVGVAVRVGVELEVGWPICWVVGIGSTGLPLR